MSQDKVDKIIAKDSVAKETVAEASTPEKTFQDIMFNTNTSKIAHKILGFLNKDSRETLAKVSVDTHRVGHVDYALTNVDFKIALMTEVLGVLSNPKYEDQLKVARNPSGFLRLNNDLIKLIKNPDLLKALPDAAELRLNFWPGNLYSELGAKLEKETGHSHPKGFVSFIVTGAYEHHIHIPSTNPNDPSFEAVHKVVDNGTPKKDCVAQPGTYHLGLVNKEKISSDSEYAYFSTSLVHNVDHRIPAKQDENDHGTLTINVVFAPQAGKTVEHTLYLNDKSQLVEQYDQLTEGPAKKTLEIVKNLLKNKIEVLTAAEEKALAESTSKAVPTPVELPITPVRVSEQQSSFFGAKKDSFDSVVEVLNSTPDQGFELPSITKKGESVVTTPEVQPEGINVGVL